MPNEPTEFKPDYRDMSETDYFSRKRTVKQKTVRAFEARQYRKRNREKVADYNRLHPEFRVRLSLEDHALLRKLFGEDIPGGFRDWISREAQKSA